MTFLKHSNCYLHFFFADDTNIFLEGMINNKIILQLNTELFKIETWLAANRLTLNVNKTHYMIFHRSRLQASHCDVILNDDIVKRASSTKFLGTIIDEKLSWKQHKEYVKNKTSKPIGIIYTTRNYVDKYTLRSLYYTFV